MKRWIKVILGIPVVIVLAFAGMATWFSYVPNTEEISSQFITAHPIDLSQVAAFSQYRSCAGHDFRHPMVATGEREKTPRSLKHYVKAKPEFRGSLDKVGVFAPFDGQVSEIDDDAGSPGDQQIWLTPETKNPASPRQWQFVFFHINLDPSLREGSTVAAGQRIGWANLARGPDRATDNFDIAMKFTRPLHQPAVDEVLTHMSPQVLADYEKYGITPDKLVISETYRDAHDCPVLSAGPTGPEYDQRTIYFPPEAGSQEYIFLK